MYDSELYQAAKNTLESSLGLRQVFNLLPADIEISVILEGRIYSTLTCRNQNLKLEPRKSLLADLEISFNSESIRRLTDNPPEDILAFVKTLSELVALKTASIRPLSTLNKFREKGYLTALKQIGPELQAELYKYSFLIMGRISTAVDAFKTLLKR
jgi:hypothetical protein